MFAVMNDLHLIDFIIETTLTLIILKKLANHVSAFVGSSRWEMRGRRHGSVMLVVGRWTE